MLSDPTGSCLPCGLHQPKRNTYFEGKFLLAGDFIAEQDYHRGHRHLHNSLLHGTGTVCGLKLIEHPAPGCQREYLVLEPGMALDCCGREIVVPERTLVRVAEQLAKDPDLAAALDGSRQLMVGIAACDSGVEPVPAILPGCSDPGSPTEYGRIAEGYELVLLAAEPAALVPDGTPMVPKLSWVHTIALGGQLPRGMHDNQAEGLLQLAVDSTAGGSHLYLHGRNTHDLRVVLEGPASLTDTAAMREARLLLAAGLGFDGGPEAGVAFWHTASAATAAGPAGVLPIAAQTLRMAVSPGSGLLMVLAAPDAETAALRSYAPAQIQDWLAGGGAPEDAPAPLGTLEFDHGFGGPGDPAARGAAMLRFSHDGRFLALAAPATADQAHVYLIEVAAFNGGSMTQAQAVPAGIPAGTDTVGLDWSLDDAYLYLLANDPDGETPAMELHRYAMTGDGISLERQGRGVHLEGSARDLAVAPTETRAYLLLQDAGGIGRLGTVDIERVKSVSDPDPEPVELSADAIRIDGDVRALELTGNGARLYVAAGDADPETQPARGLLAVIEVQEDDCAIHLDRQLDHCAGCGQGAGGCGCTPAAGDTGAVVILGHLPGYLAGQAPRMRNAGNALAGDVAIDNLTYRSIVPSSETLREIIRCMLDRGIDTGPPGPRGDPGKDGIDGADGTDGAAGTDGAGIDDATLQYVADLEEPTVRIIEDASGQRILDIDLPAPQAAALPEVNPIIATSWVHGGAYEPRLGDFSKDMHELGVALAFEHPVSTEPFLRDQKLGRNMLAYLQRLVSFDGGTFGWANISRVEPVPLAPEIELDGTLLRNWTLDPNARQAPGFALLANDVGFESGELLRIVFYADFILDTEGRPVAGAHLGGQLPSGGGPGGTFRSWFSTPVPIDQAPPPAPKRKGSTR
ncbi:hypothetical protein GCM10009715_10700 [Paeniglutamicibacter psychrophenolicus]|uniref:Collagen-like protein n=1 Tax=Paeniglutamicibacter psychrophenolicus TaxID=257454 RepID=A0ABS4WG30_9MICC|nr:hypothetical protein [Paeniglutamicibacter psychrophenolicus]MBP2375170.1 hypothetical protein [Paeniglutamicibacter psychrophenolicus]